MRTWILGYCQINIHCLRLRCLFLNSTNKLSKSRNIQHYLQRRYSLYCQHSRQKHVFPSVRKLIQLLQGIISRFPLMRVTLFRLPSGKCTCLQDSFQIWQDHEEASSRTLEGKLTSSIIRGYRFHFSQCKWSQKSECNVHFIQQGNIHHFLRSVPERECSTLSPFQSDGIITVEVNPSHKS